MTLDIGNDALLCKVFPASLQGQALSWFHRLPPNSIDNFRDLSEAFVGQYLCSARHKQNISTLQNIKMRDNESLREFVKRFGQAVLQIEACSMDAVLQIFKRSICPGTPFFESLAKKPPTTMDDLFRRANKYSMLEDDVRAATQQVLVAGRASRRLSDFKWPRPIGTDPSMRDRSKKCAFHKDHGHTTETCRSLQRSTSARDRRKDDHNITTLGPRGPQPKAVINYINGAHLTRNMIPDGKGEIVMRSIRERINSIRPGLTGEGPRPIDGTIIFPPVDPTRTLQPHRDALILSLEIGEFDVRRILVDPGSSADLVQASVVGHMGHSLAGLENPGRILSGFNGSSTTSLGDIILPHCLMQPPILSSLIPKEKLYMYLAVSEWAISAVLFRCPSPKEQKPVYYVSRALADVETRYSKMELTALALRSAAQKLRPYFQAHSPSSTDQPSVTFA
ncbi:hypothetical protein AAG906_012183 [Vitis piasezkii]